MALSKSFEAFALELFAGAGPVRIKRMFGGAALYLDELVVALLDDEAIWIKVDDENEAALAELGEPRFTFVTKDGAAMEMRYRRMPESAYDAPDEAADWLRLGLAAALRAKAAKPKRKPKPAKGASRGATKGTI